MVNSKEKKQMVRFRLGIGVVETLNCQFVAAPHRLIIEVAPFRSSLIRREIGLSRG